MNAEDARRLADLEARESHRLSQQRERRKRYVAKHPRAVADYSRRRARTDRIMRQQFRDEYLELVAAYRAADPDAGNKVYYKASAGLKRAFPDAWRNIWDAV